MSSRRLRLGRSSRPDDYMDIWRRGFEAGRVAQGEFLSHVRQERVAAIAENLRRASSYDMEEDLIVTGYTEDGFEMWGSVERVALRIASRRVDITAVDTPGGEP